MAFPTAPILDNFNTGASQLLTARAGWSSSLLVSTGFSLTTDATPTVAIPSSGSADMNNFWNTSSVDSECFFTLTTWAPAVSVLEICARITAIGASPTFYALELAGSGSSDFIIIKRVAGTRTALTTNVPTVVAAGDGVGISVIGTAIRAFWKSGAGAWTQITSVTDSSISATGFFGVRRRVGTTSFGLDNFGGGAPVSGFVPRSPDQDATRTWDRALYTPPPSRVFSVFINNTPIPDAIATVVQSRKTDFYKPPAAQPVSVFDPATNRFATWTPGVIPDRQVPNYTPPPSRVAPIAWGDSVFTDRMVQPAQSRPVPFYAPPATQPISVFDPATATYHDWTPGVQASRAVPYYAGPRAQSIPVYDQPVTVYGTDFASVFQNRITQFYNGPPSRSIPVFFSLAATPDSAVLLTQNRQVANYTGPRSASIPVFDPATATFRDWTPGVTQGRVVMPYSSPRSYASPVFFAQPPAMAGLVVQSILHSISYAAPLSRVIPAISQPIPASGYAFVAQSRGTLRQIANLSQVVMPGAATAIITEVPGSMGGGGEWVIWGKPWFPGNERGNWQQFPKPYFRKPTRRVN